MFIHQMHYLGQFFLSVSSLSLHVRKVCVRSVSTLCFLLYRYIRSGAPPVINPLHTHFPLDTMVPGSSAVTLTWILPNRTTGVFNVTSPLPGDWFLAAHLPKDEGKISVKVSPILLDTLVLGG